MTYLKHNWFKVVLSKGQKLSRKVDALYYVIC